MNVLIVEFLSLLSPFTRPLLIPFSLLVFLIFFITLFGYLNSKKDKIIGEVRKHKRFYILVLIFLVIFPIILRFSLPHYHVMYMDEEDYLSAANNIAHLQSIGNYEKSIGWPILISPFYLFTNKTYAALYLSSILSALSSFLIFILSFLLTKRRDSSFIAGFLFSLTPLSLSWAANAETHSASLFFIILSLIFMKLFYDNPTKILAILTLFSISVTAQIRIENHIFFIVFLLEILMIKNRLIKRRKMNLKTLKNLNQKISQKELFLLIILVSILTLPNAVHALKCQFLIINPSVGEEVGLNQVKANINFFIPNIFYQHSIPPKKYTLYVPNEFYYNYPLIINWLLIIGILWLFIERRKEQIFLVVVSLFFLLAYLPTWAYIYPFARDRFLLRFYPFIFINVAYAFTRLTDTILNSKKEKILTICLAILIFSTLFSPYVSDIRSFLKNDGTKYETNLINCLPKYKNCTLVEAYSEISGSTLVNEKNIPLKYFIKNEPNVNNNSCFLFVEDAACYLDTTMNYCDKIKRDYQLKLIEKFTPKGVNEELAVYKIIKKKKQNNSSQRS